MRQYRVTEAQIITLRSYILVSARTRRTPVRICAQMSVSYCSRPARRETALGEWCSPRLDVRVRVRARGTKLTYCAVTSYQQK